MGTKTELAGKTYGRWTVIREAGRNRHRKVLWLCRCTCGTEKTVVGDKLRRGLTKSCGCLSAELTADRNAERNTTHGLRQHRLYGTWRNMLDRCLNPNAKGYATYSVRGVCPEWSNRATGFEAFLTDMEPTWAEGLTLDRIDNDGPYSPSNCRWATRAEQQRNTSRNRFLTYAGRTLCLADWAETTGLNENTIRTRLDDLGWSVSRAIATGVTPERLAGAQDCDPPHVRAAEEQPATVAPDTLPAWLHWRFGPHGQPWADVADEDKTLWEHQARAVRRAVARGGFKAVEGAQR